MASIQIKWYLAAWSRRYPALTLALAFSSALCISAAASWAFCAGHIKQLGASIHEGQSIIAQPGPITDPTKISLLEFDGASLLEAIHQSSNALDLSIPEIKTALQDTPGKSYLRYRATFALDTDYRHTRQFIQQLQAMLKHLSLDAIHCTRDDIDDTELHCDITVSVFYRQSGQAAATPRAVHG